MTEDKYVDLRKHTDRGVVGFWMIPFIKELLSERDALIKERDERFQICREPTEEEMKMMKRDPWTEQCKYGIHLMTCDYVCTDPPVCPPGKRKDPK